VAVAVGAGLLTLVSMTKIWAEGFWKALPADRSLAPAPSSTWTLVAPIVALAAVTLAIGLYAEPLVVLAERAATDLLTPSGYVNAVLGPPPTAVRP
jgi:multicomponent Na+:H+ antiporter subunit D